MSLLHKLLMNSLRLFLTRVRSPRVSKGCVALPNGRASDTISWEKSSINPFFSLTRECVRVTFFDTLFISLKSAFELALPANEDNR